ncbi:Uncharacterised protein [Bordetella pertussis]|nr:Uncharacterised protein [Bordetella pertussis]CPM65134.1 Uncharacterised protein [Bordetella pertussis]
MNRSASHQTSPASMASRSVSDMPGMALRAQRNAGSVIRLRRQALKSMRNSFSYRCLCDPSYQN